MKVRLLTCLSGSRGVFAHGDEYECSAEEGVRLIQAGFAEPIREQRLETAVSFSRRAFDRIKKAVAL